MLTDERDCKDADWRMRNERCGFCGETLDVCGYYQPCHEDEESEDGETE